MDYGRGGGGLNRVLGHRPVSPPSEFSDRDAGSRDFRVLSPDFEGLLAESGYRRFFQEAEQLYGKNKILQGRYVAEAIDVIPQPIEEIISEVAPEPLQTTSS